MYFEVYVAFLLRADVGVEGSSETSFGKSDVICAITFFVRAVRHARIFTVCWVDMTISESRWSHKDGEYKHRSPPKVECLVQYHPTFTQTSGRWRHHLTCNDNWFRRVH